MSEHDGFHYDLCIIGAGLVGSSAARYASISPGVKVCLIGPHEPKDRTCAKGDEIFGTHYDDSRITARTEHVDPFWSDLAKASIRRYRDIEQQSGIQFYHRVGYISIGCDAFLKKHTNADFRRLSRQDLREQFAYMDFSDDDEGLFDEQGGWINPRKLVDAQLLVASKQGCDVIRDVVFDITEVNRAGAAGYKIETEGKFVVTSRKVLLATNVFTKHRKLLPKNVVPKFEATDCRHGRGR